MRETFYTSLKQGERGERLTESFFEQLKEMKVIRDWKRTDHWVFQHCGLDWETDYILYNKEGQTKGAEVKTLSGLYKGSPCATFVIESWKDNNFKVRPNWWTATTNGFLHIVVIVNERTGLIHFFSAPKLQRWIIENDPALTFCRNENQQNRNGRIVKVGWENKEAGHLFTIRKEEDKWERLTTED